jgi:hypothetical protein
MTKPKYTQTTQVLVTIRHNDVLKSRAIEKAVRDVLCTSHFADYLDTNHWGNDFQYHVAKIYTV